MEDLKYVKGFFINYKFVIKKYRKRQGEKCGSGKTAQALPQIDVWRKTALDRRQSVMLCFFFSKRIALASYSWICTSYHQTLEKGGADKYNYFGGTEWIFKL